MKICKRCCPENFSGLQWCDSLFQIGFYADELTLDALFLIMPVFYLITQ